MTKPTEHACDSKRIDDYLNERLSASQQAEFEAHLSGCELCQTEIQQQAAEPELWGHAVALLGQASSAAVDDASDDSGSGFRSRQVQSVLDSLAPTDDPEMLGRIDDYEIIGVVGVGGMGAVLKGFDKSLRRVVAIKIMAPHLAGSGSARTRFQREARAAAAITHHNVIDIYGVSEANGLPYLVMPYARGPSLQKRIDEGGPLSVAEVLRIGRQIAAGLTAAHEQGLVHRDIKPANILLNDGIERLLITDFGVARAMDDASMTRTGVIAGTPQYMSPEQARGESVDYRSDLFSLGSILYTACTGRPPFRSEAAYGILRRITDDDPRPIREINPDIPNWLCRIVNRLMAKHPTDRFQNAAEVTELLEGCLAHLQQPTHVALPQSVASSLSVETASLHVDRRTNVATSPSRAFSFSRPGVWIMVSSILLAALGLVAFQMTAPADISGRWQGEAWKAVSLSSVEEAADWYTGSFTNADGQQGAVQLEWSRLQRRYNGRWKAGDGQSGSITLRAGEAGSVRGAVSVDPDAKVASDMPRLREFSWTRVVATAHPVAPAGVVGPVENLEHESTSPDHVELPYGATPIAIRAPAKGSLRLSDSLTENRTIQKGQYIGRVVVDATHWDLLEAELETHHARFRDAEISFGTIQRNLEAAKNVAASYHAQLKTHEQACEQIVASAETAVKSAKVKLETEVAALAGYEADLANKSADYERKKTLHDENVIPNAELTEAERSFIEAKAKLSKAKSHIKLAEIDVVDTQQDGNAKRLEAQSRIDAARTLAAESEADVVKLDGELAKAEFEMDNARTLKDELMSELLRQPNVSINSAYDGRVAKVTTAQMVNEGDQICLLIPRAVTTQVLPKAKPEPPAAAQQQTTSAPSQVIEAPLKGVIRRWGKGIVENADVKKGDLIVEIDSVDIEELTRIEAQIAASKRIVGSLNKQVAALQDQVEAHKRNVDTANKVVASRAALVKVYEAAKQQPNQSAEATITGAKNKLKVEQLQVAEMQAAKDQALLDYDRQESLFEENVISEAALQKAERTLLEAETKLEKSRAYVEAAKDDLASKQNDKDAKNQKAQAEIDYAMSLTAKAESEAAEAAIKLSKATVELSNAEIELTRAQQQLNSAMFELSRIRRISLNAPFDGYVTGLTEDQLVKEGDQICRMTPEGATQVLPRERPESAQAAPQKQQTPSSPPPATPSTAPQRVITDQSLTDMFGTVSDLTRRLRESRHEVKMAEQTIEQQRASLSKVAKELSEIEQEILQTKKQTESSDAAEVAKAQEQLERLQEQLTASQSIEAVSKTSEAAAIQSLKIWNQQLADVEAERDTIIKLLQSQLDAATKQQELREKRALMARGQFEQGNGDSFEIITAEQSLAESEARIQQLKLLLEMYRSLGTDQSAAAQQEPAESKTD